MLLAPIAALTLAVPATPAPDLQLLGAAQALRVDVWCEAGSAGALPVASDVLVSTRAAELGLVERAPLSGELRLTLPGDPATAAWRAQLDALTELEPLTRSAGLHAEAALVLEFETALGADVADSVEVRADGAALPVRTGIDGANGRRLWIDPRVSALDAARSEAVAVRDQRSWRGLGEVFQVSLVAARRAPGRDLFEFGLEAAGVDTTPPRLVATQLMQLTGVSFLTTGQALLTLAYTPASCEFPVEPGNQIELGGNVLVEVVAVTGGQALVNVLAGDLASVSLPSGAAHLAIWTQGGSVPIACTLQVLPLPGTPPATDVAPGSTFGLRFTEALDPASVRPFDTFFVTVGGAGAPLGPADFVLGNAIGSIDGTEWQFAPWLPLSHVAGVSETYDVHIRGALTDLAGNRLGVTAALPVQLDPSAPTQENGGFVLRFEARDEDADGLDESRGQIVLESGEATGRPVRRFSRAADESQAVPGLMIPFGPGQQGVLNPLGSRTIAAWRGVDLGLAATDERFMNLDVEGLSWAPVAGQVIADAFTEFEIALGHGSQHADESLDPQTLLPRYPNSGLHESSFQDNVLADPVLPLTVVHPRQLGYTIDPLDLYAGVSGKLLLPFPWNTDGNPLDDVTYTWRDTAGSATGAAGGVGIDPQIAFDAGVGSGAGPGAIAAAGDVPSVGLPLLMDFRTYPDSTAIGLNSLSIALAINSSALPAFRAHSSGGFNTAGQPVTVSPDLAFAPTGGFNPSSSPPGQPTQPTDNSFMAGQADFVVRISRAHTRWFDTGTGAPVFLAPLRDPLLQPLGTEIRVDWRGAHQVASSALDAAVLDAYGDVPAPGTQPGGYGPPLLKNPGIVFSGLGPAWTADPGDLDGSRYVQARITFVNETSHGVRPRIDSIGLGWILP